MTAPDGAIVVGFDGSTSSRMALGWALDEADRVGAPVHVLHGLNDPAYGDRLDGVIRDALVEEAQETLAQAEELRAGRPTPHSAEWVWGMPADVLVRASERALMVVLGSRGRGGFAAALLGSVSQHLLRHAHGPAVVVRDVPKSATRVVVGVDPETAEPALSAAFEAASARDLPLTVVHAWRLPPFGGPGLGVPAAGIDPDTIESSRRRAVQDVVTTWAAKFPDVAVEVRLVRQHPAHALIEASIDSALTVVGSRGRGGFNGLLLGSTSSAVAAHAHSPVLVAR